MKMIIKEFMDQGAIPEICTCDGIDQIPTINWEQAPPNTKSFVFIMDDPDAPVGIWDHWLVFNIPKNISSLNQQKPLPANALNGKNSRGTLNYIGPCPPDKEHRYFFKLYALDAILDLPKGCSKSQIIEAMNSHILEKVTVIGLYERPATKNKK